MQHLRSTNVTVFLLFFGLSLLEAMESHHWLSAAAWLVLGLVFLGGDVLARKSDPIPPQRQR